jgi:hypothetical protein
MVLHFVTHSLRTKHADEHMEVLIIGLYFDDPYTTFSVMRSFLKYFIEAHRT